MQEFTELNSQTADGICFMLHKDGSNFAKSLAQQIGKRPLSPKQLHWALKLANAQINPEPQPEAPKADMTGIIRLMQVATASKLKHPKIRLEAEAQPVVLAVAGARARRPGTVNVTDGGGFGSGTWFGRISLEGKFEPSRNCTQAVTDLLVHMSTDPAKIAAEHGHKTGNCCFCNRPLTDEKSVEDGFGPVCAKRFGLR